MNVGTTRSLLDTLNRLDFGPLAYKLMHPEEGKGLTLEQATGAITKYKGFLDLYGQNPGQTISPSLYVDLVWHTHIMDTELYTVHCGMLFGHYLHHNPFFGKRDDEEQLKQASAETRVRAREVFGWDEDEWCGTGTPEMVAYFEEYLGRGHVDLATLINWWRNKSCFPQITAKMPDVMRYVDVERLGDVERELAAVRVVPRRFENAAVNLKPMG